MNEVTMENCLLDIPYEILFEIFRTLPKGKLIEISRLCSKFRHVAGDIRFWKNVNIKYGSKEEYPFKTFAYEDLYSEPWPVKVIDLSYTKINPPVSLQTEQMIKVARLNLSSTIADEVAIAAILAKYQCTELYLNGDVLRIGPEAFSKQTALEVLSVLGACHDSRNYNARMSLKQVCPLLAPIFKYFRNLKTLDLTNVSLGNFDMLDFVKTLPTSLEKLFLYNFPEDPFFELLAGRIPNLVELKVLSYLKVRYQSLLDFQFLEALHFYYSLFYDRFVGGNRINISDLYKYLTKFPALKTVYIIVDDTGLGNSPETFPEKLRAMLQTHGISVEITEFPRWPPYSKDGNLWKV